jgi:uncharacterized membrane protein HdeD (DUF308 family)
MKRKKQPPNQRRHPTALIAPLVRRNVRDHKMEEGKTIGLIMGIANAILGALLVWFHKPIGSSGSRLGKKWQLDKLIHASLYEEPNSRKFILVIGICLIVWGVIAFFLLPAMTGANP